MISIITAVHNQLDMNQLYVECLREYTVNRCELIVIDNNSADGSREFFQKNADHVILNDGNYSFPFCQNQGIERAKYDTLAFFNNDIIVPPRWDENILKIQEEKGFEVISFATNNHAETPLATKKLRRRWKRIKYPVLVLLGTKRRGLRLMHRLMYGDWAEWSQRRLTEFGHQTIEGYSGSCLLMRRSALDKIGLWDERIQTADFDLFNRVKVRSIEHGDILPINLALGVYIHHYTRLTLHSGYEPFSDADNLMSLESKWGDLTEELRKDIA